jgi:putative phage-type endonuclease
MNAIVQLGANGLDIRRTGRITGSRIAGILGKSPYNDRASVLRQMVREHFGASTEFTGNVATEYGSAHETDALAWYEEEKGVMTFNNQEFIIHPSYDFLAVTIDGMAEDGLVECKAPYRSKYTEMPAHYYDQVQLQMACAQAQWCDFVCWRGDETSFIQRIYADPCYLDDILPELTAFMAEYEATIRDKTKAAPHLADKGRADAEWQTAAADYIKASQALDLAKLEQEAAKQRLLDLSGGNPAKGAGVQVIKQERKGTVSYAAVVKELLPDTDLSPWQGEPSVVWTVKVSS